MKRNIMSWNTMNQNIRMINYRELYFRISNFRISTFRKSNDKKTGFVQRTLFLFFSISCALLFSFGCKPQRIISEGVVSESMFSQTDNSSLLQLKDSLSIMETQIAILESELKRTREENINLRSETLIYEVNYDTNTNVDSITKRPAVISEVYTVSKKLYEKSVREYEILLQEASIEIRHLSTRNSNLKLINESLEKENIELMSESNSMSESTSESGFKNIIIIAVVILVLMGVVYTNCH